MKLNEIANKVVFFLGAGASAEANCKTSVQMIQDLSKIIEYEDNEDEIELLHFIFSCLEYQKSWRNIPSKQNDYVSNIEEFVFLLRKIVNRDHIIPHPMVGNWSEKILKYEFKNNKIFGNLLSKIEYTYLPKWLQHDSTQSEKLLKPLENFFKDTSDQPFIFDFFTINYDLIFEKFFNNDSENILNDGFKSKEWQNSFNDPESKEKYRINYYKLHGSLNWIKTDLASESEDINGLIRKEDSLPSSSYIPLLIFGQETKMLSIDPFLSLTFRFKELLEERDYVIIIGYSFFDTYINNLIIESVNKYPEKKLIVISPFSNEKNEKLIAKKLAAKIQRIQESDHNSNIFNVKQISPEKIIPIRLKAGTFYTEFFSDKGKKLIELIKELSLPDTPLP